MLRAEMRKVPFLAICYLQPGISSDLVEAGKGDDKPADIHELPIQIFG
jgi:hypothetical protein